MISSSLVNSLREVGLDPELVKERVSIALAEDSPAGDLTSLATISEELDSTAYFRSRSSGVLSGVLVAAVVLEIVGIKDYQLIKSDGDRVTEDEVIMTCTGKTRSILLAERTALNFLSHLSGISTTTRKWVDAVSDTKAKIRDTRKTTPGLRQLEKFAVRMGGGSNHRMNLSDAALIKDNHIAAAGSIKTAISRIKSSFPDLEIEVEVDSLDQLKEAITYGVAVILLDNMSIEQTQAAVALIKDTEIKLESSGGLVLENAHAYAATGVDYLAVGSITHSSSILDIGLDF
jgi:nicotinate-nucleotide pyrophosphorylase (carboxylating)